MKSRQSDRKEPNRRRDTKRHAERERERERERESVCKLYPLARGSHTDTDTDTGRETIISSRRLLKR